MVGRSSLLFLGALVAVALVLSGCPGGGSKITEEVKLSASSHDFGSTQSQWSFQVWSKGDSGEPLNLTIESDQAWAAVAPPSGQSDGPADVVMATVTIDRAAMTGQAADGVYTATITVDAANAEAKTIALTARKSKAAIAISERSHNFGSASTPWTLQVWNGGEAGSVLNFAAVASDTWISVTPATGTSTGPGNRQDLLVNINRQELAKASYTGTITISAPGIPSQTVSIAARDASPAMSVSSTAHDFGEFNSAWAFDVWNSGEDGSSLTFSVSSDKSWLTVTPATGVSTGVADRRNIAVAVDRDALTSGVHTGKLTLAAAGVTSKTVTVSVLVPNAGIGLSADTYDFSYDKSQWSFDVWNAGGQGTTLRFNIASNVSWLSVTPANSTSTGYSDKKSVAVTVNRAAVTQGSLTGVLTLSAEGVNARTVTVTARPPLAKVGVSETSHNFGFVENEWAFEIWNEGEPGSTLTYQITSDQGWIAVSPATGVSANAVNKRPIAVTLSRDKMAKDGGTNGTLQIAAPGAAPQSIIIAARVPAAPGADFGTASAEPFVGDPVLFADKSASGTASITSWLWNFGDGTTSTEQNPSHVYNAKGSYAVSLTVTSEHGTNSKAISSYLNVREKVAPKAAFSVSAAEALIGANILFTDQSSPETAAIESWLWEFGDGQTSQGQNPFHAYQAAGTYNVKLTVASDHGSNAVTKAGVITIKTQAPKADFLATVTTPRVNETVNFVDRSSKGTASITAWQWNFGDGTTSTQQNPTHAYTKMGTYTVALNVTTAHGVNTETKASYIELQVNPPTVDFDASPLSLDINRPVAFRDLSKPGGAAIKSYLWNFGDSQTSTEKNPFHQYSTYGLYTVMLTVTDEDDNVGRRTRTDYIKVESKPPVASFTVDDDSPYSWEVVHFTDTSSPGGTLITNWSWNFGDGSVSLAQHPTHIYLAGPNVTTPVTYTATLTITTLLGNYTATKPIVVRNPVIQAQFTVDKSIVYSGIDNVLLLDTSIVEGPHRRHWSDFAAWPTEMETPPGGGSFLFAEEHIAPYPADCRIIRPDYYYNRKLNKGHGLYYQFWERGPYDITLAHHSSALVDPGDPHLYTDNPNWTTAGILKEGAVEAREPAAMDRFVRIETIQKPVTPLPDPFTYAKHATIQGDGYTAHVLRLTSHKWRLNKGTSEPAFTIPGDATWEHWLTILVPDNYDEKQLAALLYVAGGDQSDPMPESIDPYLIDFAIGSKAIVAQVNQVPNQPLSFSDAPGLLSDDDIMAYSMSKFMDTGDEFWPAVFPMVKSTTRAMDAIQGFLGGEASGAPWPPLRVEQFVLAGAGNRAWSSWLTAGTDERVRAIIPMGYDCLNMWQQLVHRTQSFGGDAYREAWAAYDEFDVIDDLAAKGNPLNMYDSIRLKGIRWLLQYYIREMLRDWHDGDRAWNAHVNEVQQFLYEEAEDPPTWNLYREVSQHSGTQYLSASDPERQEWRDTLIRIRCIHDYMDSTDSDMWTDYHPVDDWSYDKWFWTDNFIGRTNPLYTGYSSVPFAYGYCGVDNVQFEPIVDFMLRADDRNRQNNRPSWLLFETDPNSFSERYNHVFIEDIGGYVPTEYGGRLNFPKYIVNAGGDAYFQPDSALNYFGTLDAPKYLRMLPNAGHKLLGETETILSALPWFNQVITGATPDLPFTWTFLREGLLQVKLTGSTQPTEVNLWIAKDPNNDFRIDDDLRPDGPVWSKTPLTPMAANTYLVSIAPDLIDFQAYFIELIYADVSGVPLVYTTECEVVEPTCPGCIVAPSASFVANTTTPVVLQAVEFTDTSEDGSSPILSWEWDFGDGTPKSNEQNPEHPYNAPGTYTVKLTVTSAAGSNTAIRQGYIVVSLP